MCLTGRSLLSQSWRAALYCTLEPGAYVAYASSCLGDHVRDGASFHLGFRAHEQRQPRRQPVGGWRQGCVSRVEFVGQARPTTVGCTNVYV